METKIEMGKRGRWEREGEGKERERERRERERRKGERGPVCAGLRVELPVSNAAQGRPPGLGEPPPVARRAAQQLPAPGSHLLAA